MLYDSSNLLISGYAKLPSNTAVESVYGTLVAAVVVDRRTGIIQDAEVSLVTELTKRFVSEMLIGCDLNEEPDYLISLFEEYYHGHARKALEVAVKMIFTKYHDYCAAQSDA